MSRLSLLFKAILLSTPLVAQAAGAPACATPTSAISKEGYVKANGIEQWVTIKGSNCANPVIVFVHGGPGNPNTPYADGVYGGWARDFTLVQWDQRGAGRTWGRNRPGEDVPLTMEQLTADGIAVVEHVTAALGKRKVILMGSSWGSALGVHMLKARPGLFHAWVGTAHLVSHADLKGAWEATLARAQALGDKDNVARLEAMASPPWTNPRHFGVMRRAMRKYESAVTDPAPKSWWVRAPAYSGARDLADYEAGEEYSFIEFVGMKGDGIGSRIDLPALGINFDMPVFMVQGSEDLLTRPEATRAYFDRIEAPLKEYVLVPRTGHDPNQPMVEAQFRLLKERVAPLARD